MRVEIKSLLQKLEKNGLSDESNNAGDPDSQVKVPFAVRQTKVSRATSCLHDCPRVTRVPSAYGLTCLAGAQAGQVAPKY